MSLQKARRWYNRGKQMKPLLCDKNQLNHHKETSHIISYKLQVYITVENNLNTQKLKVLQHYLAFTLTTTDQIIQAH